MRASRVIFSDNGVLSDLTKALDDPYATNATIAVVAAEDYLYLGSYFPFNHRFFQVSSANAAASIVSVENWWSSAWHACVDVIDETKVSSATLGQSGNISWVPNRLKGWDRLDTNDPGGGITGLTTLAIYDLYWVRISFSANLTGSTALSYLGHKFASDNDILGEYPDLMRTGVLTSFATGKQNWNEQHFAAADYIIKDLQSAKILYSKDQILEPEIFRKAAIHKVAEIIMNSFGKDYEELKKEAARNYHKARHIPNLAIDTNSTGKIESSELKDSQIGWLSR